MKKVDLKFISRICTIRFIKFSLLGISVFSLIGSLFFSIVLDMQPCTICYILRGIMFITALILAMSIYKKDNILGFQLSIIPISVGLVVSAYALYIIYNPTEPIVQVCGRIPCNEINQYLFNLIPIPLLALIGFIIMLALNVICVKRMKMVG